jgi:hypothetical protein
MLQPSGYEATKILSPAIYYSVEKMSGQESATFRSYDISRSDKEDFMM